MKSFFNIFESHYNKTLGVELVFMLALTNVCDGFKVYKKLLPAESTRKTWHWDYYCSTEPLKTRRKWGK